MVAHSRPKGTRSHARVNSRRHSHRYPKCGLHGGPFTRVVNNYRTIPDDFELATVDDHGCRFVDADSQQVGIRKNSGLQSHMALTTCEMLVNDDLRPKSKTAAEPGQPCVRCAALTGGASDHLPRHHGRACTSATDGGSLDVAVANGFGKTLNALKHFH